MKSFHTTHQFRDFIEVLSISVKFVKLYMVLESLAFSFQFITFDNMTDELDFEG